LTVKSKVENLSLRIEILKAGKPQIEVAVAAVLVAGVVGVGGVPNAGLVAPVADASALVEGWAWRNRFSVWL
jgi:hypothetical protein